MMLMILENVRKAAPQIMLIGVHFPFFFFVFGLLKDKAKG